MYNNMRSLSQYDFNQEMISSHTFFFHLTNSLDYEYSEMKKINGLYHIPSRQGGSEL